MKPLSAGIAALAASRSVAQDAAIASKEAFLLSLILPFNVSNLAFASSRAFLAASYVSLVGLAFAVLIALTASAYAVLSWFTATSASSAASNSAFAASILVGHSAASASYAATSSAV